MTGIILAGGKSTRMKTNKAFIQLQNGTIIEIIINKLRKLFDKIFVVVNSLEEYDCLDVRLAKDIIPDKGPLGGLYTGLIYSATKYNFIIACDMPFINEALVKHMAGYTKYYDVLVPKVDAKIHPLLGVYSKSCVPIIKEMLNSGDLKITNMYPKLNVQFILEQELRRFDKTERSLINLNNENDLAAVR